MTRVGTPSRTPALVARRPGTSRVRGLVLSALVPLVVLSAGCSDGSEPEGTALPAPSADASRTPAAEAPDEASSAPSTSAPSTAAPAGTTLELTYSGGEAGGDTGRPPVAAGQPVTLLITSDVAEEVHVHGVDLYVDLVPGEVTTVEFDAPPPGVYEVEAHDTGVVLTRMQVS